MEASRHILDHGGSGPVISPGASIAGSVNKTCFSVQGVINSATNSNLGVFIIAYDVQVGLHP